MYKKLIVWMLTGMLGLALSGSAGASFHLFQITELYSNADGTIQYIEFTGLANDQQFWAGRSMTSTNGVDTNTYNFTTNLPSSLTSGKSVLAATQGFANLSIVTPDYIIPDGFLFTSGGTVSFPGMDFVTHAALPTNGILSINRSSVTAVNSPRNFAGTTGTVPALALTVSKAGTGSGTVTSSPAGINCGAICSANFGQNNPITLTATPDAGSTFAGWSGDCTGTGTCSLLMSTARSATATFNPAADTDPDPFSFAPKTNIAPGTQIDSDPITVSGINAPAPISVTGGEYSINSGAFTASAGNVSNGEAVTVRLTASGSNSTTTSATLTIGGVSASFQVTTAAAAPAATVSALRPNSGSVAGGSAIVIDGTNLDTATSVTFGGSPASILAATPNALTVAAPGHAAGLVDVVVVNPGGSTSSTGAFTYVNNDDVARDFSIAANPSPRWSYGYEPTRGGTFTLYSSSTQGSLNVWSFGGLPNLWHNPTTSTVQQVTNFTPPGKFGLHPGPSGENSVVRWTAPASGAYHIAGAFAGSDSSYPTTTDVAVLKNNNAAAPLFSGDIASYNVPLSFSIDVGVVAGDTIEFTVGTGVNGYFGDATSLDATISLLVAASVPGAPAIGSAIAGDGQATVSFSPPASDGGSPITGYTVTSNPGALTAAGTASPITVTGLSNGAAYTFTVTAQNAVGTSAPSAPSNSVTPAPAADTTPPSIPAGLSASAVSASQINLAWDASTDNAGGSGMVSYKIYRLDVSSTTPVATVTHPSTATSDLGLTASTTYTYTVAACDAAANCSEPSGPASATTLAPGQYAFYPELELGFNLIGNALNAPLDVAATFGNQDLNAQVAGVTSNVVSIWNWNAIVGRWAFYSPQLTADGNATHAASKGYELLALINPGEGYWVNAIVAMTLPTQTGTGFNWNAFSFSALPSGFNLIATADSLTPSQFNTQVSQAPPTGSFVSLWAWDAVAGTWYFHSPQLEASGVLTAVCDYAHSRTYKCFDDDDKLLGIGTGFWVNRP